MLADIDQMLYDWWGRNPGTKPTHILLHPVMMRKLLAAIPAYATIFDPNDIGKPPMYRDLEIVEVTSRTHPDNYAVILGGNDA